MHCQAGLELLHTSRRQQRNISSVENKSKLAQTSFSLGFSFKWVHLWDVVFHLHWMTGPRYMKFESTKILIANFFVIKVDHSRSPFLYFRIYNSDLMQSIVNKICQCLHLNLGSLVLGATAYQLSRNHYHTNCQPIQVTRINWVEIL